MTRNPTRSPTRRLDDAFVFEAIRSNRGCHVVEIDDAEGVLYLGDEYCPLEVAPRRMHLPTAALASSADQFWPAYPGLVEGHLQTNPGGADREVWHSDLAWIDTDGVPHITAGFHTPTDLPVADAARWRMCYVWGGTDGSINLAAGDLAPAPNPMQMVWPATAADRAILSAIIQPPQGGGGAGTGGDTFYGMDDDAFGGYEDGVPDQCAFPYLINYHTHLVAARALYARSQSAALISVDGCRIPYLMYPRTLVCLEFSGVLGKNTAGVGYMYFGSSGRLSAFPHGRSVVAPARTYTHASTMAVGGGIELAELYTDSNDGNNTVVYEASVNYNSRLSLVARR